MLFYYKRGKYDKRSKLIIHANYESNFGIFLCRVSQE